MFYSLVHLIEYSFISGLFSSQLNIFKHLKNIVNNQLVNYLEALDLLDDNQHGFRPGRLVITAGVEVAQSIIESIDKGERVTGVSMVLI